MLSPFRHFDRDTRRAIFLAGTVGLHMVSGVAVGVCIGYLLDRWLETSPRLTMIFLGVGIVAGFRNMRADARR
ncbi:MAG: AtpZ/AtpI family protein, partial [Desulfovibrio sp.]|nr:AtpZ/AtpI family protein [Desulfovibrio sp.]